MANLLKKGICHFLKKIAHLSMGFLCLLILSPNSFAETEATAPKLIEFLVQEKTNTTEAINEAKLSVGPQDHNAYIKKVKENEVVIALNKAKLSSLESFLVNQNKIQQDYIYRLKSLQQHTTQASIPEDNSDEPINELNALLSINKKTIVLISENINLAKQYEKILIEQKQDLALWKSKEFLDDKLKALNKDEEKLNNTLEKLYENSLKLQQDAKQLANNSLNHLVLAKLLFNNQLVNLTQYKITEITIEKKLLKADFLLEKKPNIRTLQTVTETYRGAISQLADIELSLKKTLNLLTSKHPPIKDEKLNLQFKSLINLVKTRIERVVIEQETLKEDLENHEVELKKQISVRQSLASYHIGNWPVVLGQMVHMPQQFYNYIKSLSIKVRDNYLWQDWLPAAFQWLILSLVIAASLTLHYLLKRITLVKERTNLSGHLYEMTLNVIDRSIPHLCLATVTVLVFYLNQISFANYRLLINLIFVWLIFRTLILVARIALLERISDASGKDVKLYHRIKWLLLTGGIVTALMLVSIELPLSPLLQDIFSRLFILFLLAVSIVGWKSREAILHLIHPLLKTKKRYFRTAVMVLVVLIPLTLFVTAMVGLVGYINLAWTISRYQVQILLIISGYVLVRGLFSDALELLSEWMISFLHNGWLWIEVLLKPANKILRVMLLTSCVIALAKLFGWYDDVNIRATLRTLSETPIVDLSGIYITPISVFKFVILLSIFIWSAKWTREFCYRWLYRDARDAGIRNSLSVFTQYAVILIGGLIAFRVLGFDFSGMSMVIGGLAVGMGFGLRDFASNIVGGLMLLVERPVREGDLITIGNHEGRVAHIGIRSMRVCSWDNMEVLIPNAETFNKPFTNWTHQDSIVRTVVPIKVSRDDDPVMVQELILDVLALIPEIVEDPPVQVLLTQIDEALICFEIRYFINVQYHTRFEIRSKVLFAITAQFKAAGIKSPIPPIQVEINENEESTRKNNIKALND